MHEWVRTVLLFLEKNGQEILQAICTRYKIPYDRSITSIPIGTWEQVANFMLVALQQPSVPFGALPGRQERMSACWHTLGAMPALPAVPTLLARVQHGTPFD